MALSFVPAKKYSEMDFIQTEFKETRKEIPQRCQRRVGSEHG